MTKKLLLTLLIILLPMQVQAIQNKDTSFKSWMDYRKITSKSSTQYKIQQDSYTCTNGIRVYQGRYCVALGTGWGVAKGDHVNIYLDTGHVIYAVMSEVKADKHTDSTNRYKQISGNNVNVVEFIIDINHLPKIAQKIGDISFLGEEFQGNITKIQKVEEEQMETLINGVPEEEYNESFYDLYWVNQDKITLDNKEEWDKGELPKFTIPNGIEFKGRKLTIKETAIILNKSFSRKGKSILFVPGGAI